MPKENRFAGIGEAMVTEESDETEDEGDSSDETEPESGDVSGDTAESHAASATPSGDGTEPNQAESTSEDEVSGAHSDAAESKPEPEETRPPTSDAESESTADADDEPAADTEDEGEGPAFEFEETTAKSIYVRRETLDRMDDAEFDVESVLRREHDIRDLTGREFHDALVRVAATYTDEVAEEIVRTRDE